MTMTAMTGFAVEMEDNSETTMNEDILAAEVNEAIDADDDEGENHETPHAAVVKKKNPRLLLDGVLGMF